MEIGKLYKSAHWNYVHSLYKDEADFNKYFWQGLSPQNLLDPKDTVVYLGDQIFSGETLAKVLYKSKVLYVLKHNIIPVTENQKIG